MALICFVHHNYDDEDDDKDDDDDDDDDDVWGQFWFPNDMTTSFLEASPWFWHAKNIRLNRDMMASVFQVLIS